MTPDPADLARSVFARLGVRLRTGITTSTVDVYNHRGEHVARVTLTPAEVAALETILGPAEGTPDVWASGSDPAAGVLRQAGER